MHIPRFFLLTTFSIFIHFTCQAQTVTEAKLLGCWKITRFEFIEQVEDSAELINAAKNFVTCFETKGKFVTKQKTGATEKLIGTGTYSIDKDGKTIHQSRDVEGGENDSPAEVIKLDNKEMAIKADNVIMHFERMPDSK